MESMEFEEVQPKFKTDQMLRLVQRDVYLKFMFNDMSNKNGHTQDSILEVLFNSNVIGDSLFTEQYEACAQNEASSQG